MRAVSAAAGGVTPGGLPSYARAAASRSSAPSRGPSRSPRSTRVSSRVWRSSSQAVRAIRTEGAAAAVARRKASQARSAQTSAVTSASVRTCVVSADLYMGLTGTTMPPAFQTPSSASTKCGVFWSMIAARSPGRKPRAARCPATPSLSASASA